MSGNLKFENVIMQPTCTTTNPLSSSIPTTSNWYYYTLNPQICSSNTPVTITNISQDKFTLNIVGISPGGGGGQSISGAYGGGGGGGGVSLSQIITFGPGQSISVTFGTILNEVDTTFTYNNTTVSAGTGSCAGNGYNNNGVPTGGNGGNGSNTTTLSNPYGSFAGGAGGNGGTATAYTNGSSGSSYNGATSGNKGTTPGAYTTITMADGTKANVATAGSEGESGNQTTMLFYFKL